MTPKLISMRALTQSLLIAALACLSMDAGAAVGVDWTLRNPSLTSESWNAVARNGDARHASNVLVAVGSHGLIVSAPGPAGPWTVRTSNTKENLNAVSWSPSGDVNNDSPVGLFVAVGNKGVVLTSPNGIAWTKLAGASFTDPSKPASPPGNQLLTDATLAAQDFVSVYWTSAQFFIGGNSAAGPVVYASSAGIAWRKFPALSLATTLKLRSITGTASSKVVVVTDKNVQQAAATNPTTWTVYSLPTGETSLQNLIFYSGGFIVSGAKTYTASSIGAWSPQTLADINLNLTLNISQAGTKIVGAGPSGTVWTSLFGVAWSALPASPEAGVKLHGAVDFGSEYAAVGDGGRIYRYASGAWTSVYSAGAVDNLSAVAANGSVLAAVGKNVSMVSTDGIGWTRHSTTLDAASVIGVGGAGFIATGTGIWTSADGADWAPNGTTFTGRLNRIVALPAAGKAIAVGADTSGTALKSMIYLYDGSTTTWTKATLPATSLKELRGAAASGDLMVTVGDGGYVLTSPDGAAWTPHPVVLAAGENFTDVVFAGSQFIASTSLGGTWTSANGVAWTKRLASGAAGISRLVRPVLNPNSLVVGVGAAGTTAISYGGTYWYGGSVGISQALTDAVWTGTQIVAVGANGTILTSGGAITPQPQVQFAVSQSSVLESAGTATVVIQLSSPSPLPVTVTFSGSTSTKTSTDLATLGTTAASDYGLPTPASVTFQPNGADGTPGETSKSITITIRQDNSDELDEKILLTLAAPTGDATLGANVVHTLTITDDDAKPAIAPADQPKHQLVNVGSALVVQATGTGVVQPTAQWKKNAANVTTGATASVTGTTYSLTYASATTAQAGAYTLLLTNPSGTKLSDAAQIGVVDNTSKVVVAADGGTVVLSVTAAGSGLSYQWQRAGGGTPVNLVDDLTSAKHIAGAKTAKVTIKKVAMNEADVYWCTVTQTMATGIPVGTHIKTGGTTTLNVVNAVPVVTPPVFTSLNNANRVVGESFASVPLPTATNLPYKWLITGLPLGLTYNTATGQISGQSTKIGTFPITYVATNVVGASVKVTTSLTVAGLPAGVVGSFMGLGLPSSTLDRSLGTRLDVTITDVATYTGKLLHGTLLTNFTGSLLYTASAGGPIITGTTVLHPVGFPAVTLNINVHPSASSVSPNTMSVQLVGTGSSVSFSAWRKSWLSVDPTKWFIDSTSLKAVYNFGVNPGTVGGGGGNGLLDATIPQGLTTASFTLESDGSVTTSGRMGDGTPFTSSGFINATNVTDPDSELASVLKVPVYTGLYSNIGALNGLMNLTPHAASGGEWNALAGSQVFYWTVMANHKVETDPYLLRVLNSSVTYPSGRYTPPQGSELVLDGVEGSGNNMGVIFREGGLNTTDKSTNPPTVNWTVALHPDADFVVKHPAVISGLVTSALTTLSITPETGFFSGSFTLVDPQPGIGTQPLITRKIPYSGLILGHKGAAIRNDYMVGYGAFTLPPLPGVLQVKLWGWVAIQRLNGK